MKIRNYELNFLYIIFIGKITIFMEKIIFYIA